MSQQKQHGPPEEIQTDIGRQADELLAKRVAGSFDTILADACLKWSMMPYQLMAVLRAVVRESGAASLKIVCLRILSVRPDLRGAMKACTAVMRTQGINVPEIRFEERHTVQPVAPPIPAADEDSVYDEQPERSESPVQAKPKAKRRKIV